MSDLAWAPLSEWAPRPAAVARERVFLQSGQIHTAHAPCTVVTILGSCVAVGLTDPIARVGGLCHYALPNLLDRERSWRYGSVAIPDLIARLSESGGRRDRLEAKVFGGACITAAPGSFGGRLGTQNGELAYRLLWDAGIPIVTDDLGGGRGRKLIYETDSGSAWVRML
jgi:chemotaxis protein CheD